MKRSLLTVAMLVLGASSAHATVTNWGVHDAVENSIGVVSTTGEPTGFADLFTFTVAPGTMLVSTSAESFTTSPFGPIGTASYALLGYGPDNLLGTLDDVLVGNWEYGPGTGGEVHPLNAGPGVYLYTVSGVAMGPVGSSYSITSRATSVPGPTAGLLFLSGLWPVGLLSLRRRRKRRAARLAAA